MLVVRGSIRPKFDSSRDPRLLSKHPLSNRRARRRIFSGRAETLDRRRVGPLKESRQFIFQKSEGDVVVGDLRGDRCDLRISSLSDEEKIVRPGELVKLGVLSL